MAFAMNTTAGTPKKNEDAYSSINSEIDAIASIASARRDVRRGPSPLKPFYHQWAECERTVLLECRLARLSSAVFWLAIIAAVLGGVQVATLLLLLVR